MSVDDVLAIAKKGKALGCTEALFTLGDKPELLYEEAKQELQELGFASTLEYTKFVAGEVLRETGLLPHINLGVTDVEGFKTLKEVSASQGLMLETTSEEIFRTQDAAHYQVCI